MSGSVLGRPARSPGGCTYMLIRTRRRTMAIYIRSGGAVEVRAPLQAAQQVIDGFVDSKAQWIARSAARSAERMQQMMTFAVEPGCKLLWQGGEYPTVLGEAAGVSFDGTCFFLPTAADRINRPALTAFYKQAAQRILREKAEARARDMGLAPKSIRITDAKTRWGSCSGKNAICFAWRLLLTPPACMDYVIVHELCHMKQHNHSAAFWQEVAAVLPDYQSRRTQLAAYGRRVSLQSGE